jgi:uncharacterized protein with ParB-like and HNH nuclease domain
MDLDNLQTFKALFSEYRFHIPDYQRGYAWTKDQLDDLLNDILTLTEENEHFTGLLVLKENEDPDLVVEIEGTKPKVFDVVDGQQRLTTIVILLNEVKNAMEQYGGDGFGSIPGKISETYLYGPGPGLKPVLRLILDQNNRDYFMHNILNVGGVRLQGPEIRSNENLAFAQKHFREFFSNQQVEKDDKYPDWLRSFYGKVVGQLKVMVYWLRSAADAGVVFESMNSRGKDPNQLDIVKNYLLFLASKLGHDLNRQLTESINDNWKTIFRELKAAELPESDEETLLQIHWLTVHNADLKHWNSVEKKSVHIKNKFTLLKYVDHYEELYQQLENYVTTLGNTAIAFSDIRNPDKKTAFQTFSAEPECRSEIIYYSNKLLRLGILQPFQPLLTAVRLRYPNDAVKYLEMVKLCEQYSFRVLSLINSNRSSFLFTRANQLYNGLVSYDTTHEVIRRDLLALCSDATFQNLFSTSWYRIRDRAIKYLLYEYEEKLLQPDPPKIKWETIEGGKRTIEHILPQTPEATGYWVDHFTEEERLRLIDQIGNLTLTEDNSALGRKPFHEKQGQLGQLGVCYANSKLKIEQELASVSLIDWTPQTIEARQQCLATWALTRWHVDAPPPLPDDPWERHLDLATRNGMRNEFLELREIAQRLGLQRVPYKQSYAYASPYNMVLSVLSVKTFDNIIEVYLRPRNFPPHKTISRERISEILGGERDWWLTTGQFGDLRSRLEYLVSEINSAQK